MTQNASRILEQIDNLAAKKGSSFKILIVDDEASVRDLFKDICGLSDMFKVDLAKSGQEAIEKVSSIEYDLVTIDLIMPEISGLEALEKIKEHSPRLPVIVITGNATERLVKEAGVSGASKVLYKPLILNDFLSEMVDTLGRHAISA